MATFEQTAKTRTSDGAPLFRLHFCNARPYFLSLPNNSNLFDQIKDVPLSEVGLGDPVPSLAMSLQFYEKHPELLDVSVLPGQNSQSYVNTFVALDKRYHEVISKQQSREVRRGIGYASRTLCDETQTLGQLTESFRKLSGKVASNRHKVYALSMELNRIIARADAIALDEWFAELKKLQHLLNVQGVQSIDQDLADNVVRLPATCPSLIESLTKPEILAPLMRLANPAIRKELSQWLEPLMPNPRAEQKADRNGANAVAAGRARPPLSMDEVFQNDPFSAAFRFASTTQDSLQFRQQTTRSRIITELKKDIKAWDRHTTSARRVDSLIRLAQLSPQEFAEITRPVNWFLRLFGAVDPIRRLDLSARRELVAQAQGCAAIATLIRERELTIPDDADSDIRVSVLMNGEMAQVVVAPPISEATNATISHMDRHSADTTHTCSSFSSPPSFLILGGEMLADCGDAEDDEVEDEDALSSMGSAYSSYSSLFTGPVSPRGEMLMQPKEPELVKTELGGQQAPTRMTST